MVPWERRPFLPASGITGCPAGQRLRAKCTAGPGHVRFSIRRLFFQELLPRAACGPRPAWGALSRVRPKLGGRSLHCVLREAGGIQGEKLGPNGPPLLLRQGSTVSCFPQPEETPYIDIVRCPAVVWGSSNSKEPPAKISPPLFHVFVPDAPQISFVLRQEAAQDPPLHGR